MPEKYHPPQEIFADPNALAEQLAVQSLLDQLKHPMAGRPYHALEKPKPIITPELAKVTPLGRTMLKPTVEQQKPLKLAS